MCVYIYIYIYDSNVEVILRSLKLLGEREGQYSIRINDQYRICFSEKDNNFYDVEIVDYH